MPALHKLIQEMDAKHDAAIRDIIGLLYNVLDKMEAIRYNYTGEDKDCKEFYNKAETELHHLVEAFTYYSRKGTYELPDHDGE